jgi:hypothetical protein
MSIEELISLVEKLFPHTTNSQPTSAPRASPGPSTQANSRFFRLPRELRDLIYEHYVSIEIGYAYHFESNKLTAADGGCIDLSLMYTCRIAAEELQDLTLKVNKIAFRATCTDATREIAGVFHGAIGLLDTHKSALLDQITPRLLTREMAKEVTLSYPQFQPILQHWMSEGQLPRFGGGNSWGETPSVYRDFVYFTLDTIWRDRDSSEVTDLVRGLPTHDRLGL